MPFADWRKWRNCFTAMKHLLNSPLPYLLGFLIVCGIIEACKDSDFEPTLQDEIQGEWVRTDNPTRHYIFADDYATTWDYNFSTVINPKWYAVQEVGDRTLMLIEANSQDTLHWVFSEIDTVMTVKEVAANSVFYFNLKRE